MMISKSRFLAIWSKKKSDYEPLPEKSGKHKDKFVILPARPIPDPQQTCYAAFGEAMRISRSYTQFSRGPDALQPWQAARASCAPAGIPFCDAVDIPLWGHQTPLQCLSTAYDHRALHFVHACLPQGFYKGDIYLGSLGDAKPAKLIHNIPDLMIYDEVTPYKAMLLQQKSFPFTYRGDLNLDEGTIGGYGVTWLKGRTYVGRWKSQITIWLEIPASRELTWLCGARQGDADIRFLHAESHTSPPLMMFEISYFTDEFAGKEPSMQHKGPGLHAC